MAHDKMLEIVIRIKDRPGTFPADLNREMAITPVPGGLPHEADKLLSPGQPLHESIRSVLVGIEPDLASASVRLIYVGFDENRVELDEAVGC